MRPLPPHAPSQAQERLEAQRRAREEAQQRGSRLQAAFFGVLTDEEVQEAERELRKARQAPVQVDEELLRKILASRSDLDTLALPPGSTSADIKQVGAPRLPRPSDRVTRVDIAPIESGPLDPPPSRVAAVPGSGGWPTSRQVPVGRGGGGVRQGPEGLPEPPQGRSGHVAERGQSKPSEWTTSFSSPAPLVV